MSSLVSPVIQLFFAAVLLGILRLFTVSVVSTNNHYDNVVLYVHRRFSSAGIKTDETTLHKVIILYILFSVVGGYLLSPIFALLFPVILVCGFFIFTYIKERQQSLMDSQINDELCYFIARQLRAGQTLENALSLAYENFQHSKLLQHIVQYKKGGMALTTSLEQEKISELCQERAVSMLCATILLAHAMGGQSARIFDRLGDSFHQEYELKQDTISSLSQVRMSTYVISSLPIVMLGFSMLTGDGTATFLVTNPIGILLLITGLSLEVLGILWMKSLVKKGVGVWVS